MKNRTPLIRALGRGGSARLAALMRRIAGRPGCRFGNQIRNRAARRTRGGDQSRFTDRITDRLLPLLTLGTSPRFSLRLFLRSLVPVLFLAVLSCGAARAEAAPVRLALDFGEQRAVLVLHDGPLARELLDLLPLTLAMEDYARAEKIAYLPRKLDTAGGRNAAEIDGDVCYYAPWGNLALFYKGHGHGAGLYFLGRIESGKEALAAMKGGFTATLTRLEP